MGFNSPGQSTHKTTLVGGGERKFDKPPLRNGGVAFELALRVDNMETAVPKLYQETLQPNDYRLRPDPARRVVKTHDSEWGPRARKAGRQPTGGAPATGPPGEEWCPARGPRVNPRDASTLSTRTGHLPNDLAPSLMPQLHDTSEQEAGGESTESALATRGPAPAHGHPGAETTSLGLLNTTPTRRPRLIDSDWRLPPDQSAASGQRPPARPTAWNNDSKGCRTQEARILPWGLPRAVHSQNHPSWRRRAQVHLISSNFFLIFT
jgi:hypothetical protein